MEKHFYIGEGPQADELISETLAKGKTPFRKSRRGFGK